MHRKGPHEFEIPLYGRLTPYPHLVIVTDAVRHLYVDSFFGSVKKRKWEFQVPKLWELFCGNYLGRPSHVGISVLLKLHTTSGDVGLPLG